MPNNKSISEGIINAAKDMKSTFSNPDTWQEISEETAKENAARQSAFDKEVEGLVVVKSLDEAIKLVGDKTLMVIGGARMYQEALPKASTLHLTRIKATVEGDTKFPDFTAYPFELKDSEKFHSDACNFDYEFQTWVRK